MKDVIIIGAGPIGLACGIEAKKERSRCPYPRKRDVGKFDLQLSSKHDILLHL